MEYTDYYAVKRAPLEEIRSRLQQARITALISDGGGCKSDDKWVVVEAPSITGFKVPGDYSTFSVLSDPWEDLKRSFPRIFRFFVEEGQSDWSIKCGLNGEERCFEFYAGLTPYRFTQEDKEYLSVLFELAFDELVSVLKPGAFAAAEFCTLAGLPYFEMEMQDKLQGVVPAGTVKFSSELPG